MRFRYLTGLLAALVLSGCATELPNDFRFDPNEDGALLVLDSRLGGPTRATTTVLLARIDPASSRFETVEQITLSSGNQITPEADSDGPRFSAEIIQPGAYAYVGYQVSSGAGDRTTCYAQGTSTFEVGDSSVTLVSPIGLAEGSSVEDIQAVRQRAATDLSRFGIDQPVTVAKETARISFNVGPRLIGPGCPGAATYVQN